MSESLFSCCHYRLYPKQRLRNDDLKHNLADGMQVPANYAFEK